MKEPPFNSLLEQARTKTSTMLARTVNRRFHSLLILTPPVNKEKNEVLL